ncbi:TFIIIC transcription initiation factor complex subunit [Niveomyces insectorum RCEF 264]|uniref:TFIIIC transcription initiation factor complex subunit n=1 Tax=Niveomyces insectorum RCEF 264 TaxID=1081102 RepID=A0A167LNR3_9HYPO|nr:TFIIIC transcription initiation factor complex subunit [Niveomyces insectorum RCEF 264]
MANGLDELVDWLVGEVAFSGERGKSVDELLTAVSIFYAESQTPENPRVLDAAVQGRDHDGNGCTSEKCDGGHSIRTNDAVENKIDIQLARSVWGWLRGRSEIVVGRDVSKNHLSLDDALALPEVNLSEAKLHEPLVADDNEVGHIAEGSTETAKTADGAPRLARKKGLRLAAAPIKDSDGPTTRPRLYATEQTIWYALTGHDVDFKKIPPLEWKCLMGIASAKKSGILQADLRALVNQDKRSVPKRTDFLARKGYAVKRTIIANGFRTSILWLTTFAPPKIAHTDTLEAAIPQAGIEAAAATSAKASPTASQSEEFVAGGINLSTAYLTKDLEPVSWRSRWMGKSIEFASFGQTILAIVKAWGVIRLVDLKKKLGVQGRPWQMRTLARVCREFVASGVLKFVAAVRQVNRRLFKDCIKFERDPTKSEWAMYLAAGRKRMPLTELRSKQKKEQQLSQRNQRQKQKQAQKHGELQNIDGEGRAAIELAEFSGESSDDSGVDDGHTATAAVATLPFWVPERPLVNLVFDIVQQAGARGITSPEICKASVGPSFGRYIFSLVTDMASFGSQPHNLGRFQLASAATRNNKNNAYVFKAAITVASRNATDISGRSRPLSRTILPRLSHIFGFSTLVDLAVNLSQQSSLSVLAHGMIIMDNFRWRKNGRRKYGQQTEREKAFETDIEAYLSAPTTETQSGEKNIDRIDAIMLEDESDSGNGGGVAFSLQKQKPAPATGLIREPEKLMNQSVNERPSVPPEIPELQVARDPSMEHDGDDEEQPRDIRNNMGHTRENNLEYSSQQGAESNNVMGQGFDDILPSSAERSEVENQRKAHALSNKVGAIFTRYNGSPGYLTIDRKRRTVNFISESTAARESILSIPIDNITNDPSICDAPDGYGRALIFEATGAEKHPLAPSCVSPFVFLMDDKTKVNGQSALAFCNALMDFRLQRVARDKNEWQDNNGNENDNSQTEAMPFSECSETGNRANMPRGLVHFTVLSSASNLPAAQGNPGDSFGTTVLGKGAARFTGLVGNRAKGFGVARLPTSVSLKSQRVAKIIKYLVDESGGVFPGERSLWYAVFGVYTNNFTGEDPPTLKICMSVVKRLEIIGEVEEHTFGFRNDKGLFVYCRLLARPGVDIFGSEAARMIKGRIQESHPYPYVPPNFTPKEEDMATLRAFDKNPSKTHNSRGRRNLAPKIEVLNAPFYELAAQERLSQIGRNASSFVEDDESEEFLGSARDTKDDATESEIYGVQNIKKRNVINDESDDTSNLAKRRNVESFACAVGSVQTKFHGYAEEKAMGEWERGDIIASLEADDLDVQECEDNEEDNVRFLSGTLGKQSLGSERLSSSLLLPGYERGREIQGGKATTRFPTFVQVLPRNTRGEGGIENEDDSDKRLYPSFSMF